MIIISTSLKRRRFALVALLWCTFVLPGCAFLPPVIQQASLFVSGASYLATGKGPSDHALSIAAKKDCSFFRLFTMGPLCVPVTEDSNRPLIVRVMDLLDVQDDEAQAIYTLAPRTAAVDQRFPIIPFEISD